MNERQRSLQTPETAFPTDMSSEVSPRFDPDELGAHLSAFPVKRIHQVHGEGYRYAVGGLPEESIGDLSVFPDAGFLIYVTEGAHMTMRDQPLSAEFLPSAVVFNAQTEQTYQTLTVNRFGEAVMVVSAKDGISQADREVADRLSERQTATRNGYVQAQDAEIVEEQVTPEPPPGAINADTTLVSHQPDPWEEPEASTPANDTDHQTATNTHPELNRGERIVVTGRAGRDPRLAETKGGIVVAKFPLGEHGLDASGTDVTIWHNVVGFRQKAQEIVETVKKGDTVKVAGYRHITRGRDGRETAEIYAASVRPPSPPRSAKSE